MVCPTITLLVHPATTSLVRRDSAPPSCHSTKPLLQPRRLRPMKAQKTKSHHPLIFCDRSQIHDSKRRQDCPPHPYQVMQLMMQFSSQTNELYQLAAVAFCLLSAWCSDKLGLSLELGSFMAGVMVSTTDFAQHTLDQVEPIRNLFAALFLSSIGMLIHVHFLWNHVDILLASVILVVVFKTAVATIVTKAFGYNIRTSLIVGISLAQIGEFAFVLLSRASNIHLVEAAIFFLHTRTSSQFNPIQYKHRIPCLHDHLWLKEELQRTN